MHMLALAHSRPTQNILIGPPIDRHACMPDIPGKPSDTLSLEENICAHGQYMTDLLQKHAGHLTTNNSDTTWHTMAHKLGLALKVSQFLKDTWCCQVIRACPNVTCSLIKVYICIYGVAPGKVYTLDE